MRELSELAQRIPKSETIAIADKARQMQASGLDVIALAGGEPDFDTITAAIANPIKSLRTE
jgi:aspartate aminotransferase